MAVDRFFPSLQPEPPERPEKKAHGNPAYQTNEQGHLGTELTIRQGGMLTVKITSPGELLVEAQKYFRECDNRKWHYTLAGLAMYVGYRSRGALFDLPRRFPQFEEVVSWIMNKVEDQRERRMLDAKSQQGYMFDLKNNHGYSDVRQVVVGQDGSMGGVDQLTMEERGRILKALRDGAVLELLPNGDNVFEAPEGS